MLSRWASKRPARPDLKIGICGEHGGGRNRGILLPGGDELRLLLPFRVPIARLAAAQPRSEEYVQRLRSEKAVVKKPRS
jgi:hypothetical protein